ncbi:MAG: hypothetical protein EBU72_14045, partial [Betaproteobacteria bacterium]|nr:hypothetical protein [Betaproteobacteria bacterium]
VTGAAYDLANASAASTLAFGSVRTSSTASLAVTNAVRTAAAYQDDLSVASAFGTNKLTAVNPANIAAGVTRDLVVTAAKAGLLTDTLTLTYGSKALAISGLADGANTTQAVAVTGTAYDVAQPAFNATLALNNIRTGAGANLAVGNTTVTAAAYQDDLAIAASAANGKLTLTNPALVAAGASGNVAVVANAAGSLAGDLTLGFTSKALAASGLADVGLTGGTVTVSGFAYDLASASVLNTLNVGNVRKGDTANIVVGNSTITNASYQDALQVAATSSNTGVLTVANPANITAGQTGNVVLTTGVAGSLAGTNVSLVLTSKAAASGLSDATLTPQTVAIAGAAYDYASPDVPAGLTFGNVRLGATATLAVGNTTIANASYQDALAVTVTSAGNAALSAVAGSAISAGSSGNVVFTANAPGSLAGTASLGLQSKALAGTGLDDKTLTPGSVAVTGTAYDLASATYGATVSFGNVRLNTPRTLTVTNALRTVGAAAYQD